MTNVIARIKVKGKHYEILVDVNKALKLKKGEKTGISEALASEGVFYDAQKGLRASNEDLKEAFGTTDQMQVAEKIVKSGEIQIHKNREMKKERIRKNK